MQAINPKETRASVGANGKEYGQESAKTDGMSKGPASQGAGGDSGNIFALGKRGGAEYSADTAKTDGMCK